MPKQIVQITPASGFLARYMGRDGEEKPHIPVVLWALVEDDEGHRTIEGMHLMHMRSGRTCEDDRPVAGEDGGFIGYIETEEVNR